MGVFPWSQICWCSAPLGTGRGSGASAGARGVLLPLGLIEVRRGAGLAPRAGCGKNLLGRTTDRAPTTTLGAAAGPSTSIPQILRRHTELSTKLPWTGAGDSSARPESLCCGEQGVPASLARRGHWWYSARGVRAAVLPRGPCQQNVCGLLLLPSLLDAAIY